MTPRLSGHFSIFGLVFFVLKSLLGIARQWSREKFANLSLEPRNHVRIVIHRTCAIVASEVKKIVSSRIPHPVEIAILSKLKVTFRMQVIFNSPSIPFFKVIIGLLMLKLYCGFVHFNTIKHSFFQFCLVAFTSTLFSSLKPEDKH